MPAIDLGPCATPCEPCGSTPCEFEEPDWQATHMASTFSGESCDSYEPIERVAGDYSAPPFFCLDFGIRWGDSTTDYSFQTYAFTGCTSATVADQDEWHYTTIYGTGWHINLAVHLVSVGSELTITIEAEWTLTDTTDDLSYWQAAIGTGETISTSPPITCTDGAIYVEAQLSVYDDGSDCCRGLMAERLYARFIP